MHPEKFDQITSSGQRWPITAGRLGNLPGCDGRTLRCSMASWTNPRKFPNFFGCFNGFSIATLPHWAWYWLNLTDMHVVKHLIWVPHFGPYPAALATGSSDPSDFYPQQLLDRGTGIYQKYWIVCKSIAFSKTLGLSSRCFLALTQWEIHQNGESK